MADSHYRRTVGKRCPEVGLAVARDRHHSEDVLTRVRVRGRSPIPEGEVRALVENEPRNARVVMVVRHHRRNGEHIVGSQCHRRFAAPARPTADCSRERVGQAGISSNGAPEHLPHPRHVRAPEHVPYRRVVVEPRAAEGCMHMQDARRESSLVENVHMPIDHAYSAKSPLQIRAHVVDRHRAELYKADEARLEERLSHETSPGGQLRLDGR